MKISENVNEEAARTSRRRPSGGDSGSDRNRAKSQHVTGGAPLQNPALGGAQPQGSQANSL